MPTSRAYSSSSGGAACLGATQSHPLSQHHESGGDSEAIQAKKKICDRDAILWPTPGQTDVTAEIVI